MLRARLATHKAVDLQWRNKESSPLPQTLKSATTTETDDVTRGNFSCGTHGSLVAPGGDVSGHLTRKSRRISRHILSIQLQWSSPGGPGTDFKMELMG